MALLRYLPFIGLLAERDQSREIMSLPTILILHATSIVATTTVPPCGGKRRSDLHSFMYLLCNGWILFKYELLTSTYTIVFVRYHYFPKTWLTSTKFYRLLIWNRYFCRYSEIQAIFFGPVIQKNKAKRSAKQLPSGVFNVSANSGLFFQPYSLNS